ncbi:hypothetical protein OG874_43605 [Nocardia sp. NBC_00565]|uniref:hypothetical protein n=1 Tax=Nocardia sp. NBC_00565 TaxID=2975993 RepID=UPI002E82109B|nr:hypothetical protein [Nocardia sp. NBC_00565]WUC03462.1 hypothetical protein OG874_43605 [Nocardia sp. NBC_00565]
MRHDLTPDKAADSPIAALIDGMRGYSAYPKETIRQSILVDVARFSAPAVIAKLIDSMYANPDYLAVVAARSYHHANHFDKIILVDDEAENGFRLAIHLWRPPYTSDEVGDDQIHSHRCEFWSNVLFGALDSLEYCRSDTGTTFTEVTYGAEYSDTGAKINVYTTVGDATLADARYIRRPAGTTYHLPDYCIHRIRISIRIPTATILVRGPHTREMSSVFSNTTVYAPTAEMQPLTVDQLRERLHFIGENLP